MWVGEVKVQSLEMLSKINYQFKIEFYNILCRSHGNQKGKISSN